MRFLVDTNVVLRIAQPGHRHHSAALQSVMRLMSQDHMPVIVPQVLYEYWVVATRSPDANGLGMTCGQAHTELLRAREVFDLLADDKEVLHVWEQLVNQAQISGRKAHDAHLVAAMIRHDIRQLLTFNDRDFMNFQQITVMNPMHLRTA